MPGLSTHIPQAPASHMHLQLSLHSPESLCLMPAGHPSLSVSLAPQTQHTPASHGRHRPRLGALGAECPGSSGLQTPNRP